MKWRKNGKHDERQRLVQAQAGLHAFCLLLVLNVIGGLLAEWHGSWATPYAEFVIPALLASLLFFAEVAFRGAYYGRNFKRRTAWIFLGLWVYFLLTFIVHALKVGRLVEAGKLTEAANPFILQLWLVLGYAIILGAYFFQNRKATKG